MLDIEGVSLTPADRDLIREPAVGGVILFARNYESPEQITDLVARIRALKSPPVLVAVDHEGGRVQRFRDGFSRIPAMRQIGHEYDRDPEAALALARQAGWLDRVRIAGGGIDLCFAPCVDLDWGISEIIGDRAFHNKPEVSVSSPRHFHAGCAAPVWRLSRNIFPGMAPSLADSHLKLPVDRRDYGMFSMICGRTTS